MSMLAAGEWPEDPVRHALRRRVERPLAVRSRFEVGRALRPCVDAIATAIRRAVERAPAEVGAEHPEHVVLRGVGRVLDGEDPKRAGQGLNPFDRDLEPTDHERRYPMSNLMPHNEHAIDRVARVLLGVGLLSLLVAGPVPGWGLLGLVGLVPLVTGAMGTCPIYTMLGLSTWRQTTSKEG
jgi:hypothetical protein